MREIIFMAIVVLFAWSIAVSGRKKKVGFQAPSEPSRPPLTDAEREAVRQAEEAFDTETSDAIHDGTYAGPLPERVDGGRWSDLYPDIYRTSIARIAFRRNIKDLAWLYFDCIIIPSNSFFFFFFIFIQFIQVIVYDKSNKCYIKN